MLKLYATTLDQYSKMVRKAIALSDCAGSIILHSFITGGTWEAKDGETVFVNASYLPICRVIDGWVVAMVDGVECKVKPNPGTCGRIRFMLTME